MNKKDRKDRIEAYMCHHIRGPMGDKSTRKERDDNRADAVAVRKAVELTFPGLKVYCPGENDVWGEVAYVRRILTIQQILEIDCAIIDTMDCMLVYDKYGIPSNGMSTEINHCRDNAIPWCCFNTFSGVCGGASSDVVSSLGRFLEGVQRVKFERSEAVDLGHRNRRE